MKITFLTLALLASFSLVACQPTASNVKNAPGLTTTVTPTPSTNIIPKKETKPMKTLSDFTPIEATQATITTTKGDITIELFRDKTPLTTLNFLTLAKEGYYDGIVFHRVIPDFMIQVGDPNTKEPGKEAQWGQGGPGYSIADEFDPTLKHDAPGIVSMANAGPNTGGSQIFITHVATPWLDGKHAVFGKVIEGQDVVDSIAQGDKILSIKLQ